MSFQYKNKQNKVSDSKTIKIHSDKSKKLHFGLVQPKLRVSQPEDVYEQEADKIAEQVIRMPSKAVQRKCSRCQTEKEEEVKIDRKADTLGDFQLSDSIAQQIDGIRGGGGQSLDDLTRNFIESRVSFDFSKIRIHTDEKAARISEALNAQAFTVGNHIVFRAGQYAPNTNKGRRLLAHELTHVVQQGDVLKQMIYRQKDGEAESVSKEKHYTLEAGITLIVEVENKVAEIADAYYNKTKKNIVVTSGTRVASEQAEAMLEKLKEGDDLGVYKNKKAAAEIKKVYDDGVKDKKSDSDIKVGMTEVIEKQIKDSIYISNHLLAGAVDIRNKDMSDEEKETFKKVAKEKGINPLEEGKPPHFHLDIK